MSYIDTGDDELDYGEEELGDRDAGPTSFQPGGAISALADDEMVQDEDYEDLYDDVNIGYFQAPAELPKPRAAAVGDAFGVDYEEEDAYDRAEGRMPGVYAEEQRAAHSVAGVEESGPVTVPGQQKQEGEVKGLPLREPKEEPTDDIEQEQVSNFRAAEVPGPWSREGMNSGYSGHVSGASASSSQAKVKEERDQEEAGSQVERTTAPSRPKEQGDLFSNVPGQRMSAHQFDKSFSPKDKENRGTGTLPSGNGEALSGTAQIATGTGYEGGGTAGRGFSGGAGKMVGSGNARGRGGAAGMAPEGGRGTTAGPIRSSQGGTHRDSSPNITNDYAPRHAGQQSYSGDGGGGNMLFVGELHWWTTDAELEAALSEYGRVKNLKFFEERVSGKSKGYCQVDFYDHAAATACKQGMNGRKFHDRPCLVAFANTRTIQQMGYAQDKKAQAQFQAQQAQSQSRRTMNDTGGARGGSSYQEREGGRGYGRMGTGGRTGHGQGLGGKGGQTGPGRGRGSYMGKGMSSGSGSGGAGVPYGQGHSGPMGHQSGMMMHQGIMGQGYDPGYGPPMGRGGAGYGGYVMPGPPFSGMVQPFPSLGPGGLPGVAPHVNPAFFGRSATSNGMGMMPGGGMEGHHQGMWGEATMSGWGGEEHERRARDGSYGEDGGAIDYGYSSELGHDKGRTTGARDKENGDWVDRRRRDDRDGEWERERYRERERDGGYRDQRDREREREKDDDWERDRPVRMRNKARTVDDEEEEDQRLRSRDEDYGKRRRLAVER